MKLLAILLLPALVAVHAAPPTVKSISPTNGDRAVDPATKAIRIEFDQDMNRSGFSICGGGPQFPKTTGRGGWQSARTFVIPVKLEPEHDYRFSVNCPSAQDFRSISGEPAKITPISFRTSGTAAPAPSQRALNREAVPKLREVIEQNYSYRDRVVKDWKSAFDDAERELIDAQTQEKFAQRAGALLEPAQDPHLFLKVGSTVFPSRQISLQPNASGEQLAKLVPNWKKETKSIASGRFDDGIGYLLIGTWQGDADSFKPLHTALDSMLDAKGMILDLRFNAGGDERIAQEFASRFVSERAIFAKHRVRNPLAENGWEKVYERAIEPAPEAARHFKGKVAVLMGPNCFSSNESFLLMMRMAGKAKSFGERSFGSSGNPQPHDLGNGVIAMVPCWQAMNPAGEAFEGVGIPPDVAVKWSADSEKDSVLDSALQWLRE